MMRSIGSILAAGLLLVGRTLPAQDESRYTALFYGGQRITAPKIDDWGRVGGDPKIRGAQLQNPGNHVRWIADGSARHIRTPRAYVEMVSGDRLPGAVMRLDRAADQIAELAVPDHLVVQPNVPLKNSRNDNLLTIRVDPRMVRRLVWRRRGADRYQPGTVYYRDGRSFKFRGHRFRPSGVELLTATGTRQVSYADIAELHLPWTDPWPLYFDELSVLSPDLKSRLFQVETTDALVATASTERMQVAGYSNGGDPRQWYHVIHPAWSLDAFAVRHDQVAYRRYFLPHEVPLARIAPRRSENRSPVSNGWAWQTNRNVRGGPLESGGLLFGWGLGVHGRSELEFPLTPLARTFHTRLGLDRQVGTGGCARGRVLLSVAAAGAAEGPARQPLYQSNVLVGSAAVADSGSLQLAPSAAGQTRRLILEVDPVVKDRPAGADPLDVRDSLDWLEPVVTLDPALLAREVQSRAHGRIVPWHQWAIEESDPAAFELAGYWDALPGRGANYRPIVRPGPQGLTLTRSLTVAADQKWLIVSATRPVGDAQPSRIELRVDGAVMSEHPVPIRTTGQLEPRPLIVPLGSLAGRRVRLDVALLPADPSTTRLDVDWRNIALVDRLPMLRTLFEDQGRFELVRPPAPKDDEPDGKQNKQDDPPKKPTPPPEPAGAAEVVTESHYSGTHALKLTPPGRFRVQLPQGLDVRGNPDWGQFRYLRFAFRKRGGGNFCVEYEHDLGEAAVMRHDAGRGAPSHGQAVRVWESDLPDAWIVVTRDLFGDFGSRSFQLRSLVLSSLGGDGVLVDHVYLARSMEDFDLVTARPSEPPELANQAARRELAKTARARGLPATVLITADGRTFSGAVVRPEGLVLTAGHAVVRPGRKVTVLLASGRLVPGESLGVDRANDVALVKITEPGTYPHVDFGQAGGDRTALYLAIAHPPKYHAGDPPLAHLSIVRGEVSGLLLTNFEQPLAGSGGPLLNLAGQLIGVHSRPGLGGYLYVPSPRIQPSLERMKKGEVWGEWASGSGPILGIEVITTADGCRITAIHDGSPAGQAKLQVGDVIKSAGGQPTLSLDQLVAALGRHDPAQTITLHLHRAGKPQDVKVELGQRP